MDKATLGTFDVAVIGGGINGASLYNQLCRENRRVILIDRGDFASGTSQASSMMIWGGLLYLGSLDLRAVCDFSACRDQMIRELADWVSPCKFRFLPAQRGLFRKEPAFLGLYLYWLISLFARARPRVERRFPEQELLARNNICLLFEEAQINQSDARFVLHWITRNEGLGGVALNYCELRHGEYHRGEKIWRLSVRDRSRDRELTVRARVVVNCAGVWTDRINAIFGIRSPVKHVFSKGVTLGLRRHAEQTSPLIFDTGEHNDVITSIPWGPILMWGPTETSVTDIDEGYTASAGDFGFLLDQYRRCYKNAACGDDIVSYRCGVRPLAVDTDYDRKDYPLKLSRRSRIIVDRERSWVSVYGSKLTSCNRLAASVVRNLDRLLPERESVAVAEPARPSPQMVTYPGVDEAQPSIEWCIEHEYCVTLEDYLRRRTNIAQWVPREGLGVDDENLPRLRELSLSLAQGNAARAERALSEYRSGVVNRFDRVLAPL